MKVFQMIVQELVKAINISEKYNHGLGELKKCFKLFNYRCSLVG